MDIILSYYKVIILMLAIAYLIFAALFLKWSNLLTRLNEASKKWISTDKLDKELNLIRDIDPGIMKKRRFFGLTCIAIAALFIFLYIKY